tara:strand:- start:406 stop:582 length:177 start_codon:yes stop_codon:yes gene_type:complete
MESLNLLTKIYNKWGAKKEQENIAPLTSADEMLWNENVTPKQESWLRSFIVIWEEEEK